MARTQFPPLLIILLCAGGASALVGLILCGGFYFWAMSLPDAPMRHHTNGLSIDASVLHQDYAANEVAADRQYKGELLEVRGVVKSVGRGGLLGEPYVELSLVTNEFLPSVHCEFSKSKEADLAGLSPGRPVVISGRCRGRSVGAVLLGGCSLVK